MKAAQIFPLVLVNVAILGITGKMYWYDHFFPLWAAIVNVIVVGAILNTIVLLSVSRKLGKTEDRTNTK